MQRITELRVLLQLVLPAKYEDSQDAPEGREVINTVLLCQASQVPSLTWFMFIFSVTSE